MNKRPDLPYFCYSTLDSTGETILIKYGESGYYKCNTGMSAKELNKQLEVDEAQAEAMKCGSMFGWDVPGANPEFYR